MMRFHKSVAIGLAAVMLIGSIQTMPVYGTTMRDGEVTSEEVTEEALEDTSEESASEDSTSEEPTEDVSEATTEADTEEAGETYGVEAESEAVNTAYYTNQEAQNYTTWASVVQSYLVNISNQKLMKVYGHYSARRIDIEYYDLDGKKLSSKTITSELPLFGGFYETANNYYVITGQKNSSESKNVECIRISKFDKNWNRVATVGIKDCNTSKPFSSGSLRVTEYGKYLIIRTCHDTYKYEDGYARQSNMTIELDTDTMSVTDLDCVISDYMQGSVSHSFNQFVKMNGRNVVAVDHGDTSPRSIALYIYQKDASDGRFSDSASIVSRTDIINLPGTAGDINTAASVGGFEITDNSYMIAGSSLVTNSGAYKNTTVRNVYIATVSKATGNVSFQWLSNYSDGASASTPHLVAVGENQYMVLWSRNNRVYYRKIDGNGNALSKAASIAGNLSDCKPVKVKDQLVWYVDVNGSVNDSMTFYKITIPDYMDANVRDFVSRLYEKCLGRSTDKAGLKYWYDQLYAGKISGAAIGASFVFSDEYKKKKTTDSEYVDMLYRVFMDRESDTKGKNYWLNCLKQGVSREYVFKGFVDSKEYLGICNTYGIDRGSYTCKQARDQNIGVTGFVTRIYSKALNRTPDEAGLNAWCGKILTKKMTPEAVAQYFITSKEFTDKKLSDDDYIKVLYQTFFGREYDVSGLLYWKEQMKKGQSRTAVLHAFATSKEFKAIMAEYGL